MPAEYESGVHVDLPWHKLPTAVVLERQFNTAEALEHGGLDWKVIKEPAVRVNPHTGEDVKLGGHYWLVRDDTQQVLNHCGEYYTVIQNEQGLDWMDRLLGDEAGFHYTDACCLRRGEKVVLTARAPFPLELPTSNGELYVVLLLNHGSASIQAIATPVQVVCMNTLLAALNAAERIVKIRHTKSAEDKLANAQQVLGLTRGAAELTSQRAEELFRRTMNERQVQTFLEALVPDGTTPTSVTRAFNLREAIGLVYHGEELGQPEMLGTAWGLWNAVVAVDQHIMGGRDSREGTAAENVFERIMNGDSLGSRAAEMLVIR
jgi:phage/plasmid-like protein (TIGR03299 family)